MTTLTTKDIEVLIEALKRWQTADMTGVLAGTMLFGLAPDEKNREDWRAEIIKHKDELVREAAIREETSTILRAKLIQLRNQILMDQLEAERITALTPQ